MLSRISEAIKAKMNDILDNADNPHETFHYAFEKVMESLRDTRRLIADITETKQVLQIKASTMNRTTPALYTEALDAIAAGDEDAARNALQRQHATFLILEELHDKITNLERQQQVLIAEIPAVQESLASLRDELKELPAEPKLTLSPEEKARIRPIIEETFRLDEQITRILEEAASAFSSIHIPETPGHPHEQRRNTPHRNLRSTCSRPPHRGTTRLHPRDPTNPEATLAVRGRLLPVFIVS